MKTARQLWLLAGGNGAGKTTFYQQFLSSTTLPFVNADILARHLDKDNAEQISYEAARLATKLRMELLEQGTSFCFETVFSHPSKIEFLMQARDRGYEIILIYIHLQNADLNQARVVQRVQQGGHSVPMDKIVSRLPRTRANIHKALPLIDIAQIYDNSRQTRPFIPIARLNHGELEIQQTPLPEWAASLLSDYLPI